MVERDGDGRRGMEPCFDEWIGFSEAGPCTINTSGCLADWQLRPNLTYSGDSLPPKIVFSRNSCPSLVAQYCLRAP